jgi:ribonuclease R
LNKAEGKAEEGMINTALIRTMAKAVYSVKDEGHFGLAFEYYTHFTSPIRRYPDLVAHRLLFKHLHDKDVPEEEIQKYKKVAANASEREREVLEAERESIRYKQVEFMQDKVGEEFDAVISGVSEYGLYVEEEHTKAEGMVHVSNIGDDYFELDENNYALVGQDTGKKYTLGDEVRVKLTEVNMERNELDFVFAEGE